MTEKENLVKAAELHVKTAELAVRATELELEEGKIRLTARYNIQVNELRVAYEQAKIDLEHEKNNLAFARDTAEKGFEE